MPRSRLNPQPFGGWDNTSISWATHPGHHLLLIVYNNCAQFSQLPEWARDRGPNTIAAEKANVAWECYRLLKTLPLEEEITQEAKEYILGCLITLERLLQIKNASSRARIPEFKS